MEYTFPNTVASIRVISSLDWTREVFLAATFQVTMYLPRQLGLLS